MRKSPLYAVIGLGVAMLAAGAACSGSSPAASKTEPQAGGASDEIVLVATEFRFGPTKLTLPAGRSVTLVLKNEGKLEHDLVLAGDIKLNAKPGQTTRLAVTLATAGKSSFFCSIPGHKDAGMTGELLVQ